MNIALIVAAGSGTRMENANQPKQFLLVCGKPLLIYTIAAFQNHNEIDKIVVVTNDSYIDQVKQYMSALQQMGHTRVRGYLWFARQNQLREIYG